MNSTISSSESPRARRCSQIRADRLVRARVLRARLRPEVDALEHERAEREHRRADLVALDDVARARPRCSTRSWTSVSIRCAPVGPRIAISSRGRSRLLEDPVADRVVDVVVDVGDAVDDPDDLPLERLGLAVAGVREDPVDHLAGEVEPLGDARRLLVVAEARRATQRRRAPPRRRGRTAGGRCRGRARSPRSGPRSAAARARRRGRCRSSRACASCACGSGRPPGR